jgi:KDO2-lipid IV(A) lauroyltransferase
VREGGRWTRLQHAKNTLLYVAITATLAVTTRFPAAALAVLGRGVGLLVWALAPRLRRRALANVGRALPGASERARAELVRRTYGELGARLGEAVAMLDARRPLAPLPFLPGARECLEEAIAAGSGVVFASAHLGPWERVAASLVAHDVPLTVVAREPYDPRLGSIYERLRGGRAVRAVYRGSPGAGIALVRVLRRRGVLGIPMDLRTRAESVDVPFFGVAAPTAVGAARLALRTGAAVVVGTAARDASGRVGIACTRVAGASSERDLTARINAVLEDRIRAMPDGWPWMHDRWPMSGAGSRVCCS